MASVWRHPNSKFWSACFTDANGRQLKRSTKETNRATAQRIAEKFEAAYRLKLTESQARKVVSDIYEVVRGEVLFHATVRKFLTDWLAGKKLETVSGSHKRYTNAVDKLLAFLGERADRDIAYVHKRDLSAFRDQTARELSASTANTDLKILRIAFRQAVNDGLRLDNPASAVSTLKDKRDDDVPERRPFTGEELNKVLAVAKGEWHGMILAGVYTAQRLGDVASMRWRMIDLPNQVITFNTKKTGRIVLVPIVGSLLALIKNLAKAKPAPNDPVFPIANQSRVNANGESRRLSAEFHALLVKAGLTEKRGKKNTGKGHSVRRTTSELSYHSLRHNATSWLKDAGVPESIVRDIVGHESELVSQRYTHVNEETKRDALAKMPEFN